MQISDQGLKALELEEGVVLRAYRDSAGVLTIGCGLTAASGVVTPTPGMVITREEADRLLREALRRNYEPAVELAMSERDLVLIAANRPAQHEFDAGVSFHFNTGAIGRASWVKAWKGPRGPAWRADVIDRLKLWSKAGGKVLPGLEARRIREAAMLLDGTYRTEAPQPVGAAYAKWGIRLSAGEIANVRSGLQRLGYEPGLAEGFVSHDAAVKFQVDHNLTVDGIIGRATLSTLQRALDARTGAVMKVPVAAAVIGSVATGAVPVNLPHIDVAAAATAIAWVLSHAWSYRDILATAIDPKFPRAAAWLRAR